MPELPEVETICKALSYNDIVGKTIVEAETLRANLRIEFQPDFCTRLQGRVIKDITRRSKYILILLDNGDTLIIHLGMSGTVNIQQDIENIRKHDHVIISLSDGRYIVYNDPRRFGLMVITDNVPQHKLISHLGVEPLTDEFDADYLLNILQNNKSSIKGIIMNAKYVVGVGNIYASESLFDSHISPLRIGNNISKSEAGKLVMAIKNVLQKAINAGGSTISDFASSDGESGYFQHQFKVYGRDGDTCHSCDKNILKIKQHGRSSFYCSQCQK